MNTEMRDNFPPRSWIRIWLVSCLYYVDIGPLWVECARVRTSYYEIALVAIVSISQSFVELSVTNGIDGTSPNWKIISSEIIGFQLRDILQPSSINSSNNSLSICCIAIDDISCVRDYSLKSLNFPFSMMVPIRCIGFFSPPQSFDTNNISLQFKYFHSFYASITRSFAVLSLFLSLFASFSLVGPLLYWSQSWCSI